MNKTDLINAIAAKVDMPKKTVEDVLSAFEEIVTVTLKQGGDVTLTSFGTFSAKERSARMGVNPQKPDEKIHIPASITPKFKAGKGLKDALNS